MGIIIKTYKPYRLKSDWFQRMEFKPYLKTVSALVLCNIFLTGCGGSSATNDQRTSNVEPDATYTSQVVQPYSVATSTSVPRAICGAGSEPETGLQGQLPSEDYDSGRAARGYTCNTELISQLNYEYMGSSGSFNVMRYVDTKGHECAYFDTSNLSPINLFGDTAGVAVVDMSDLANPVLVDSLKTPAMLSPHESLILNEKRGLLIAVLGNPATYPGIIDIYDLSEDCREPKLRSSQLIAGVLGHESGISPDGNTFYTASALAPTVSAVDIKNPDEPKFLSVFPLNGHGISISDDGNTAYITSLGIVPYGPPPELTGKGVEIFDVSEVQARLANPMMHRISNIVWDGNGAPQYAAPFRNRGRWYLFETDEFGAASSPGPGSARIIDVTDNTAPEIIADVRLEVHQEEHLTAIENDPDAASTPGYSAHYCDVERKESPTIAACSMGISGLRVFDIRNPYRPREIAYFNPPSDLRENRETISTISRPIFVRERKEIWYADSANFYVVRLTNNAWPEQ